MPRVSWRRGGWAALRVAAVGIILIFLARAIVGRWADIAAFPWRFRPLPLAASLLLQIVAGVFWATVWRRMAVGTGAVLPWAAGVRAFMLSNLAKYVPGSVWGYVGRGYLARDYDRTAARLGVSVAWEIGAAVVASLLLTASVLALYDFGLPIAAWRLVLAAGLLSLVGMAPPVARRWVGWLGRRTGAIMPALPWRDLALYLAAALLTHVLVGSAFFLFAASLVDVELRWWWAFVGVWSFSATAGLLVVVVPYGLGVKEGLLSIILAAFLPGGAAALLAAASRLWTVVGELLQAALALIVLPNPRR
jgi:hypothetical protein